MCNLHDTLYGVISWLQDKAKNMERTWK